MQRALLWIYCLALAAFSVGWLTEALRVTPDWPPFVVLAGWVGFNLFVWHWGIPTRQLGLVSLERLTQVGALLAFGAPVAAGVNAAASLLWPFTNRDYSGGSWRLASLRAVHNAGMTAAMTLAAGAAYQALGGTTPLTDLRPVDLLPLVAMALTMQAVNIVCMATYFQLAGRRLAEVLTWGYVFGDLVFVPGGVLVAALYWTAAPAVFVLFASLLALMVLGAAEVARAREALEGRVAERTEALQHALHERDAMVAQLERLTKEDPLTGLANRRHLDERLEEEVLRAARFEHPLAIALADLDHFKLVNDELGHAVGDEVLRVAGVLFKRHCRAMDVIARYGGEEFALVLPETDAAGARVVCDKLRAAFAEYPWHELHAGLRVTVSIGMFEHRPGMDSAGLLDRADRNLYQAKESGRDRVVG